MVTVGHARFNVLTPELIRIERAADQNFEDHASLAFLNRRLLVPQFQSHFTGSKLHRTFFLDTPALHLVYHCALDGDRFSADDLSISFKVGNVSGIWHPGDADTGNLGGTTRTLDRIEGSNIKLEAGLLSRDGWALVDDSPAPSVRRFFDVQRKQSMAMGTAAARRRPHRLVFLRVP